MELAGERVKRRVWVLGVNNAVLLWLSIVGVACDGNVLKCSL